MALDETREIACYLRNGSLWIGHFVVSDGQLDFGDERFDAAHGLACLVYAEATSPTNEVDPPLQAWNGSRDQTAERATSSIRNVIPTVERLKIAA